ncbi:MAG: hypothetical protein JWM78_3877 [Verrucomicrobiaceae bacterium]|nr:hypothetical protein [Verrucomicrobiaceae bacterium]
MSAPTVANPSLQAGSIAVGIGACVLGAPVRYNGVGKKPSDPVKRLGECFTLRPFCPEVAIGLGVPRPTIRLVGAETSATRAVDSDTGEHDVTAALGQSASMFLANNENLYGYIFVKASPSCGMERVKRYNDSGNVIANDAIGIFAAALMAANPLLPVEEDGRLHDDHLRESFVTRVYTYFQWCELLKTGLTLHTLQKFYARHKYLIMSRHIPTYKAVGSLLAQSNSESIDALGHRVITLILDALKRPATRAGHTNALQHIRGYLKRDLDKEEKCALNEVIEQYRSGDVPLVVPLTLLRHHFRQHPDAYIEQQVFMQPYPDTLRLRNLI